MKRRHWSEWFDEDTFHQLKVRYGDVVDVDTLAKDSADFCARKPVKNPTGLLIARVRSAHRRATNAAPLSQAQREIEADRHAAYACQLYQFIAEQQLTPDRILAQLEDARRSGLQVNTRILDRLRSMGDRWPSVEPAAEPQEGVARCH